MSMFELPEIVAAPPCGASLRLEDELGARGYRTIAGLDEAGRGPLAGPVSAAAVILDPACPIPGLNDSKQLKAGEREALFAEICAKAVFAVAFSPPEEVDRINVLQASLTAMRRALAALPLAADYALIDGNMVPKGLCCPARAVVGGDAISASIAAASIVAKVLRDRMMARAEEAFAGYGFGRHFGYATPGHRSAIAALGPCALHRQSFAPFRNETPDLFGG
jgi:ribonuclease HII